MYNNKGRNSSYRMMEEAAFNNFNGDNYDPEVNSYDDDDFDPEADNYAPPQAKATRQAGSQVVNSPGRRERFGKLPEAQFDLTITSTANAAVNIELFNAQFSITEFENLTTNPTIQPLLAAGVAGVRNAGDTGTANIVGYMRLLNDAGTGTSNQVYFAPNGDMVYNFALSPATGAVIVHCNTVPYRALLKYSERGAFTIYKMRMNYGNTNQILNDITWKHQSFLGAIKTNRVSPSSYRSPDQFQSLIIDVPVSLRIDAEKGLFFQMDAGNVTPNVLGMSIFVKEYTRSAL